MKERNYTYEPSRIGEKGKDKMRFELGDTMVEGAAETTALTDEEIIAILELYPANWKRAKLALVESLCRRFSYEVDTKVGPLSLGLGDRLKAWQAMYEELKAEIGGHSVPSANPAAIGGGAYFYAGMQTNPAAGKGGGGGCT